MHGIGGECALKRRGLQRPEEGSRFPMFGVTGDCELLTGYWEPNLCLLQEQQPPFTAKAVSLVLDFIIYWCYCYFVFCLSRVKVWWLLSLGKTDLGIVVK